ncbi:MAG: T9SS type A sorting domain-containing protein [Bacteroidales bacterium]|nr:T9SS type A sorting domain-containing protein [Bacteroidales bacterium]
MKPKLTFLISIIWLLCIAAYTQDFEIYKAVASDRAETDYFGSNVSISGNYAIVGSRSKDYEPLVGDTLLDAGSVYIFERDAEGNWNEVQQLFTSDRDQEDYVGSSVSISGNYAVIGAASEDHDTLGGNFMYYAGSAYILERDGYGSWSEVQKIMASDRKENAGFGCSVSISENSIIVGAENETMDEFGENELSGAGAVYFFERNNYGLWNQVQKIVASDRDAYVRYGAVVSIYQNHAIVGAPYEDKDETGGNPLTDAGAVYVYERNSDGIWNEVQKIVASDRAADDYLGWALDISGNYIIVGAKYEDEDTLGGNTLDEAGSAYIFEIDSNGRWNEVQKIVAPDRATEDYFGTSVSISNNTLVIGADGEDEDASGENTVDYAGSAYIFERDSNGNWSEIQKIVASERSVEDGFGGSVCVSGDYAIIGVTGEDEDGSGGNFLDNAGAAYFFESCPPGSTTDPDNIIENGDFEDCILSPWSVFNYYSLGVTADAVITDGACTVTNITLADDPTIYHVQLNQELTAAQIDRLEVNSTYELTFDAWAETDNRPCRISFEQRVDPWANIFNDNIELSTTPSSYTFEFIVGTVFEDMQLSFQLGTETSSATFDNVRLVMKPVISVYDKSMENVIRIMPNPATDFIQVISTDGSTIRLYNNLGVLVKEVNITNGRDQLDVSSLTEGIYFIKIKNEATTITRKVIIK